MTYAFIDAAVIALRLKKSQESYITRQNSAKFNLLKWAPWTFLVLSFCTVLSFSLKGIHFEIKYFLAFLCSLNFIILQVFVLQSQNEQQTNIDLNSENI